MSKIICVASQKAGVGKTTTAVNIATSFALFEKKTLLIDCDPQGDAGDCMGIEKNKLSSDLYDVFMGKTSEKDVSVDSGLDFLKILPSRLNLVRAEHKLSLKPGKEMTLHRVVQNVSDDYDFIIIDSPSSLGFFTVCAMAASDWLLVPLKCQYYALESFRHLLEVVHMVRHELNSTLKIAGILLTMCDNQNELLSTFSENDIKSIKDILFSVTIPYSKKYHNNSGVCKPFALDDIQSTGAASYFSLSFELMNIID